MVQYVYIVKLNANYEQWLTISPNYGYVFSSSNKYNGVENLEVHKK